ncbi:ESCO1/2 acetyl-transferase-domain-containing protein [Umbelopsis sp. AD052]|nr:ESCO1/2 acetyl-transferase-domain-containing protein [Umbelopsis sp. AD052]
MDDTQTTKARSQRASKSKQQKSKHSPYEKAACRQGAERISSRSENGNSQQPYALTLAGATYLKYMGYKGERVVQEFDIASRIVMVGSGSSKHELRKLGQILDLVNTELSSPTITAEHLMYCKSFLYIGDKKQVLGCLVAEPIEFALRVAPSTSKLDTSAVFCSPEKVPALCGISRIWVHPCHRGKGIATRLLNSACKLFIYGHPLDPSSIAFSQPTGDGKNLAMRYTQTSKFLVYPDEAVKISHVL